MGSTRTSSTLDDVQRRGVVNEYLCEQGCVQYFDDSDRKHRPQPTGYQKP